jgi:hypothetical protein
MIPLKLNRQAIASTVKPLYSEHERDPQKCSLYGGVHYIEVSARLNSYMYQMHSGRKSDRYNILFQSESSLIRASSE